MQPVTEEQLRQEGPGERAVGEDCFAWWQDDKLWYQGRITQHMVVVRDDGGAGIVKRHKYLVHFEADDTECWLP